MDESKTVNFGSDGSNIDESKPIDFEDTGIGGNDTRLNTDDTVINNNHNISQMGGTDSPQNYSKSAKTEFDLNKFYRFLDKHGYRAKWERCYLCPCVNPETMSPNSNCPICHGQGIAYLPATDLNILIQSQGKGARYQEIGLMDSGSALGTPQVGANVSFRDRISIPDSQLVQSYIMSFDDYRLKTGIRIPYQVQEFLIVKNNNFDDLLENVDFSYDQETHIFKPLSDKIQSGSVVSINISVILRYVVVDLLKTKRYQYTEKYMASGTTKFDEMPEYLLLKREDAWIGTSSFTSTKDGDSFTDPKRPMDTNGSMEGFGF